MVISMRCILMSLHKQKLYFVSNEMIALRAFNIKTSEEHFMVFNV